MHQPHPGSPCLGAIQLLLKLAFQLICNIGASFEEFATTRAEFG
jgi:hypothetical protein